MTRNTTTASYLRPGLRQRRAHDWRIDGTVVLRNDEPLVDLLDVQSADWRQTSFRTTNAILQLHTGTATVRIVCITHGSTEQHRQFRRLVVRIIKRLGRSVPESSIHMRGGAEASTARFFLACVAVIVSLLLLVTAAVTAGDGLVLASLFGAVTLVTGLVFCWRDRPWPADRLTPEAHDAAALVNKKAAK